MFIIIGIVVHRFPNPRTDFVRLKKWIDLVGLNEMDPNDVYKKKFICNNHFDEQCFSPGTKRLNARSYPTLLLPGSTNSKPSQPSVKASISIHQSDVVNRMRDTVDRLRSRTNNSYSN
ncbi:uncharacterized protein LOC115035096 [Acyrthosiphon pisum]|uniref:THAP-type domain-containing protein n=1 Tax=Acyrthosiphon pisum TaxID=7029 RepID=A0A8R2JXD7_ACYPI|nr:uncharacterized protein LOC115035096 [Acyrthosiphon pisum]